MRKRIVVFGLVLAAALVGVPFQVAQAKQLPSKFSSCTAMNRVYVDGIAGTKRAAAALAEWGYKVPVKPKVYRSSPEKLDLDADGVMCSPRDDEIRLGGSLKDREWETVIRRIRSRAMAQVPSHAQFDTNFAPSVPDDWKPTILDRNSRAFSYWAPVVPTDAPIHVLVYNKKLASDKEWLQTELDRLGVTNFSAEGTAETGVGTAADGMPVYVLCQGVDPRSVWWLAGDIHEMTHIAQGLLLRRALATAPCWFVEGMADLYMDALTPTFLLNDPQWDRQQFADLTRVKVQRGTAAQQAGQFISRRGESTPDNWLAALHDLEPRGVESCAPADYLHYAVGELTNEKLQLDFGEGRILEWMRLTGQTNDWKSSFKTAFGLDADTWYRTGAAPYLAYNAR